MIENWKTIEGFGGVFEVSDLGRVTRNGQPVKTVITQKNNGSPFMQVVLYYKEKKLTTHVHRLVARYFLEGYEKNKHVVHIDGDTSNNEVTNLEFKERERPKSRIVTTSIARQKEVQEEILESKHEWIHLVKEHCVTCPRKIKNPVANYIRRGNFCEVCISKMLDTVKQSLYNNSI